MSTLIPRAVEHSRRVPARLLLPLLAALILPDAASAQSPSRVLFLGGGSTSHDPAAMRAVMEPVLERNNMVVDYKTNESVLHADSLRPYHVLFIYNAKKGTGVSGADGTPNLTAAQENALYKWVEDGHVVVGVHSATSSYLANPRWHQLFGAQYTVHGEDLAKINIVKPTHACMQGVSAPTGWDEGREHRFLKTDTILMATSNSNGNPWTWIRPQGKGWVYYTSSGHDTRVWSDTKFQNQLVKAVAWGASFSVPSSSLPRTGRDPGDYAELLHAQARFLTRQSRSTLRVTDARGRNLPAGPGLKGPATGIYFPGLLPGLSPK